ncbi:tRNA-splicing endonuclease subunit Sen15 [Kalaharituber pfeilii]|nr:tRNA-splicing endonuclease subunit Sen15 [Kalaharituber pfeilii]
MADQSEHIMSLVSIVYKNLQHQADWSELTIHSSPNLPRPLISGLPPETIYVDPDAINVDIGNKTVSGNKKSSDAGDGSSNAVIAGKGGQKRIDREWVLPVDLREKWTIRKWAEVFDSIPAEPPGSKDPWDGEDEEGGGVRLDGMEPTLSEGGTRKRKKRLVMGIVSGDSTVVYYIVHDGIVKPRQN